VKGVKEQRKFSEGIGSRDHRQTIPSRLKEAMLAPFAHFGNENTGGVMFFISTVPRIVRS